MVFINIPVAGIFQQQQVDIIVPEPPAPSIISAYNTGRESTVVTWTDFGDANTVKYRLYQDNVLILETVDRSMLLTGVGQLSPDTAYNFEVRAVDAGDTESDPHDVDVTTLGASLLTLQTFNGNVLAPSPTTVAINNGNMTVSHTGGRSGDPMRSASGARLQMLTRGPSEHLTVTLQFDTPVEELVLIISALIGSSERLDNFDPPIKSVERTNPAPAQPLTATMHDGNTSVRGSDGNSIHGSGQENTIRWGDIPANTPISFTYGMHAPNEGTAATAFIKNIILRS